jgi:Ser/Thr protein kinase RdoA (MazF antagonist)
MNDILSQFGLTGSSFNIAPVGSGYIHHTFKLTGSDHAYILQRVNKNVFKQPEVIASNLKIAADHICKNHSGYNFLSAIPTSSGKQMAYDADGFPWRLFPYFNNTYTVDKVETADQAESAAAEFAKLVYFLKDVEVRLFKPTIDRFHDLSWRYQQFCDALADPAPGRTERARDLIDVATSCQYLVNEYENLIKSGEMPIRITHNDTKINNVLFDLNTNKAVCAIDLDTLMPGYFIYDIGDMIRTFVSPVDEEEQDLSKIIVRGNIYRAIQRGYLSVMGGSLTSSEIKAIPFSGMMMTYIMALRMLTDFLNGDIYYKITYQDQNLIRARNQFTLLNALKEHVSH